MSSVCEVTMECIHAGKILATPMSMYLCMSVCLCLSVCMYVCMHKYMHMYVHSESKNVPLYIRS